MYFAVIAQAAQSGASGIIGFLPFILILVVVYFLMLRPQVKKQKLHTAMLNSLGRGDDIVTAGGMHGKIIGVSEKDNTFQVQIAKGITVNLEKGSVARKRTEAASDSAHADNKVVEHKPRRSESVTSSRELSGAGQPGSAMVVSGARTASAERAGGDGTEAATKKSRYRRSRRRKPAYPQSASGRGPGQDASADSSTAPISSSTPPETARSEPPAGESQNVSQ